MNATVGDIAGNAERISDGRRAAREAGADLVLFPELALTGYPPEDLLLREHFLADADAALGELAADTRGVVAVVGFPERAGRSPERALRVHNAAAILADGSVHAIYRKVHLPNYGVFDEQRYFRPGPGGAVIDFGGNRIGLTVCEDIWEPGPPATDEARAGATLIVNISASPYHAGKGSERERMFAERARREQVCIAFCALVGGQDELVFDGHSFVVDHTGETIARAAQFREQLLVCDVDLNEVLSARRSEAGRRLAAPSSDPRTYPPVEILPTLPDAAVSAVAATLGATVAASPAISAALHSAPAAVLAPDATGAEPAAAVARSLAEPISPLEAEVYAALTLGLHDYVTKNGFGQVVLGLSGGIDSALVACLAVDALGAGRVNVAIMPSRYSSSATQGDARALAAALGVRAHELPIEPMVRSYAEALRDEFDGGPAGLTDENLQARIRGNLLMALSNNFGWLVLTTGNKSEMSVGYTTLYGDLAGGFAVIKDVPKTLVYRLCEWRNSNAAAVAGGARAPIPRSIIERAPSAELRPDQRDEDSLPAYDLLDRILHGYIELHEGREQLIAQGLGEAEVERTIRLVDLAEYKRRQAPPGIKVTGRAFGRDRRMPITNRYRG
jgi:NAD+ synthase (glutamine-hydrolysing)